MLLLLHSVIALAGCAKGYRHPRLAQYRQTVRTVAVVPFGFATSSADTLIPQRIAEIVRSSAYTFLQTAHNQGRFTTALQPLARTDSLLQSAGVSARTIDQRTNAELGRILDVDAILRGSITAFFDPRAGERAAAAILGPGTQGMSGKVSCVYELVDARSQDLIWHFTEATEAGLLRGGSHALDRVGRAMAAKYPLTR